MPVSVRMPTVWISGTSAAATRHLMSALGAQSPTARAAAPALPVQPAELILDGAKWCNLLAAPVTTPGLALSALSTALPASPLQGPSRTGPLWLANSMLQVNPWSGGLWNDDRGLPIMRKRSTRRKHRLVMYHMQATWRASALSELITVNARHRLSSLCNVIRSLVLDAGIAGLAGWATAQPAGWRQLLCHHSGHG